IDWQVDSEAPGNDVPNYVHRHVLRDNVNGTWGAPLIVGSALQGDTITLNYTNFPMDPSWNPAQCALVAYAHNVDSYEVLQAEERKFQP
ncbi:MAG: Omp28-related outer membrane protein, partial [Flavobacteriales bacterium]|nr:Omp28-related outer membrane protein [Flavobacteriales bacterium]